MTELTERLEIRVLIALVIFIIEVLILTPIAVIVVPMVNFWGWLLIVTAILWYPNSLVAKFVHTDKWTINLFK